MAVTMMDFACIPLTLTSQSTHFRCDPSEINISDEMPKTTVWKALSMNSGAAKEKRYRAHCLFSSVLISNGENDSCIEHKPGSGGTIEFVSSTALPRLPAAPQELSLNIRKMLSEYLGREAAHLHRSHRLGAKGLLCLLGSPALVLT